jgi:hypothetical protein
MVLSIAACGSNDDPATVPGTKGHTNGSVTTTTTSTTIPSGSSSSVEMGRATGG